MRFPSKKDLWLGVVVWGAAVFGVVTALIANDWISLGVTVLVWGLVGWIWFSTGYDVDGDTLHIHSGPLRQTIPVSEITRIRATRNPLASMALSLDRLEIRSSRRTTMVSPEDKERFIRTLLERNPNITVQQ